VTRKPTAASLCPNYPKLPASRHKTTLYPPDRLSSPPKIPRPFVLLCPRTLCKRKDFDGTVGVSKTSAQNYRARLTELGLVQVSRIKASKTNEIVIEKVKY